MASGTADVPLNRSDDCVDDVITLPLSLAAERTCDGKTEEMNVDVSMSMLPLPSEKEEEREEERGREEEREEERVSGGR